MRTCLDWTAGAFLHWCSRLWRQQPHLFIHSRRLRPAPFTHHAPASVHAVTVRLVSHRFGLSVVFPCSTHLFSLGIESLIQYCIPSILHVRYPRLSPTFCEPPSMNQLNFIALIEVDNIWKFLLIWLVLTWRVVMDRCDRGRIREHIARGGGKVVNISWSPFGRGWFGEGSDRIYEVTYTTRDGKAITATCKTSMTTGVFWSSENPPSGFSSESSKPTKCLACGARIPAKRTRCLKCNWSYEEALPTDGAPPKRSDIQVRSSPE